MSTNLTTLRILLNFREIIRKSAREVKNNSPYMAEKLIDLYWIITDKIFPLSEIENNQDDEAKANVRLISAAPELLDALRAIVNYPDYDNIPTLLFRKAMKAIEHATSGDKI